MAPRKASFASGSLSASASAAYLLVSASSPAIFCGSMAENVPGYFLTEFQSAVLYEAQVRIKESTKADGAMSGFALSGAKSLEGLKWLV